MRPQKVRKQAKTRRELLPSATSGRRVEIDLDNSSGWSCFAAPSLPLAGRSRVPGQEREQVW